ncbi:MAG: hypothetical protein HY921_03080 [Elusimicrobia bacterium]|nr:hypothetical protein [Elusimicrobiota bacterium]
MGKKDYGGAALIGAVFFILYISHLSKGYVFEGLARAMPIELGMFRGLFNGNHLIYGFAGSCFHGLLGFFGWTGLAVVSLQIMDSLLGAAGAAVFFLALRRLGGGRAEAAAWACVLGLSLGYWSWSVDAQDYIFSTFLLCLNFAFLSSGAASGRLSPWAAAAFHALAVLGHVVNAVFVSAPLWFLYRVHGPRWRPAAARYAAGLAGLLLLAYGSVLLLIVRPASWTAALDWLWGSAAAGGGKLGWHGRPSLESLRLWAGMTVNIFASLAPAALAARLACVACFALAAFRFKNIRGFQKTTAVACLLWLAAYALVFTSWEPNTMVYRVSDLVPLTALLFLASRTLPKRGLGAALGTAFAILLGTVNFRMEIRPRALASNNRHLRHMGLVKDNTAPGDWVAGEGGADELYIPYFAQRRPLAIGFYSGRRDQLRKRIDSLKASGQEVFVTSTVLRSETWAEFFKSYDLLPKASDPDGYTLYTVK